MFRHRLCHVDTLGRVRLQPGLRRKFDGGLIGSFSVAWLSGITFDTPSSVLPTIPESVFVIFQMTFAIITPASGFVGPIGGLIIGIVATLAWCGGATFVLLKVIDMIVPLRVSADEETEGLDLVLHEESGYNL